MFLSGRINFLIRKRCCIRYVHLQLTGTVWIMDATAVKDTYGLSCNPDYVDLLHTYQPLWLQNEAKQSRAFQDWVNKAALHLSVIQDSENTVNLHAAGFEAVVTAVLEQVLAKGEKHAPELHAELTDLVQNGVPNILRPVAWRLFLRSEKICSVQKYSQLIQLQQVLRSSAEANPSADGPSASSPATTLPAIAEDASAVAAELGISSEALMLWRTHRRIWDAQIDKDCHRTFPGHDWLSQPSSQAALSRVLRCFCLTSPQLGYCQGLNLLAGALLLVATNCGSSCGQQQQQQQQQSGKVRVNGSSSSSSSIGESNMVISGAAADWTAEQQAAICDYGVEAGVLGCLMSIAADVLPGYFSPAMVAPQVDQRVLSHLLHEHFPQLSQHLQSLGVEPSQPLPGWLLSGFVSSGMPFEAIGRLWDVAFFERSGAAMVRACLALFHLFGAAFLSSSDVLDAHLLLQAMPGLAFDADRLMLVARGAYKEVNPGALQALQHCFRAEVVAEMEAAAAAAATCSLKQQQQCATDMEESEPSEEQAVAAEQHTDSSGPSIDAEKGQQQQDGVSTPEPARENGPVADNTAAAGGSSGVSAAAAAGSSGAVCSPVSHASWTDSPVVHEEWVPDFENAATAAAARESTSIQLSGSSSQQAECTQKCLNALPQGEHIQQQSVIRSPSPISNNERQSAQRSISFPTDAVGRNSVGGQNFSVKSGTAESSNCEEGDEDEAEEGGRLLLQQSQQQQQNGRHRRGSSSGVPGAAAAAAGASSSGSLACGQKYRILSSESAASSSRAIAQALAIASKPGLLPAAPPPVISKSNASNNSHRRTNSTGTGSSSSVGATSTLGAFFGNVVHHQQQQEQLQQQRSGSFNGSGYHGSSNGLQQQQQQQRALYSNSSNNSSSSSSRRMLTMRATEEDEGEGGWMLLGTTPPAAAPSPIAAAAAAAAAAAMAEGSKGIAAAPAAAEGPTAHQLSSNGNSSSSSSRSHSSSGSSSNWQSQVQVLQSGWSDAATAAAAAGFDGAAASSSMVSDSASNDVPTNPTAAAAAAAVVSRYNSVVSDAMRLIDQLVTAVSQHEAQTAALNDQLERSMKRLELQDADAASKDELIDQQQQQIRQLTAALAAAEAAAGRQQQQQHSAGGSSMGGGPGGFVQSALARFHSPTKSSCRSAISETTGASSSFGNLTSLAAMQQQQQHEQVAYPPQQIPNAATGCDTTNAGILTSAATAGGKHDSPSGSSSSGGAAAAAAASWKQRLMSIKMLKQKDQQPAAAVEQQIPSAAAAYTFSSANGNKQHVGVGNGGSSLRHHQQQQQQHSVDQARSSVMLSSLSPEPVMVVVGGGQPHLPPAAAAAAAAHDASDSDMGQFSQYVALEGDSESDAESAARAMH